jgi:hypothetical protein
MGETWTCARCGVRASFESGSEARAEPVGWAHADAGWHCLGCRRTEVIEAAAPSNAVGASATRRRALTEFELLRDPEAPDRLIARRVKCPTGAVSPIRAALHADGRLRPVE